ncbi:MAG TPA: AMP-binding protein, partial [Gemmatimonadaceae bacterium]|nr:AMP-binding protein [Gemmatimonadaceae bacterium]
MANGRAITYAQVNAKAAALAAALAELGIGAGDRIAIVLPNWSEWVIALLAASKLGSTVVPVNPRLSHHELKYQLRHAEVSAVVALERHHGVDYLQLFEDMLAELPDLLYLITVGGEELWYDDRIFQFEDLLSSGEGRDLPSLNVDDGSDLALIYTSGTMGKPKGVRLSNRAIVEMSQHTGELLEMEPADRVFAMVPFFTLFGLSVLIGVLAAGATLVLQEEFDASGAVALLQRERVTVMHGVPMMYQLIMRAPEFDPAGFPSLRTGIIAGGAVSEELVRRIRRWCNVQLAYGLTETGATMTMTRFSDPADKR